MVQLRIAGKDFALVLQGVSQLDAQLQTAGEKAMLRRLLYAAGRAQKEGLSGPRPGKLGVVTGRLRGSISVEVTSSSRGAVGRLGANVPYARWHEFGFQGAVEVRAHNRVVGVVLANGQATKTAANKKAVSRSKLKTLVVGFTQVESHTRQINYAGRPYIRPALAAEMPLILKEVAEDLAKSLPKPNSAANAGLASGDAELDALRRALSE